MAAPPIPDFDLTDADRIAVLESLVADLRSTTYDLRLELDSLRSQQAQLHALHLATQVQLQTQHRQQIQQQVAQQQQQIEQQQLEQQQQQQQQQQYNAGDPESKKRLVAVPKQVKDTMHLLLRDLCGLTTSPAAASSSSSSSSSAITSTIMPPDSSTFPSNSISHALVGPMPEPGKKRPRQEDRSVELAELVQRPDGSSYWHPCWAAPRGLLDLRNRPLLDRCHAEIADPASVFFVRELDRPAAERALQTYFRTLTGYTTKACYQSSDVESAINLRKASLSANKRRLVLFRAKLASFLGSSAWAVLDLDTRAAYDTLGRQIDQQDGPELLSDMEKDERSDGYIVYEKPWRSAKLKRMLAQVEALPNPNIKDSVHSRRQSSNMTKSRSSAAARPKDCRMPESLNLEAWQLAAADDQLSIEPPFDADFKGLD